MLAIFVQEAAIIGVDCLGFDLRLCSGTQVQTLRFAFPTKVNNSAFLYEFLIMYDVCDGWMKGGET